MVVSKTTPSAHPLCLCLPFPFADRVAPGKRAPAWTKSRPTKSRRNSNQSMPGTALVVFSPFSYFVAVYIRFHVSSADPPRFFRPPLSVPFFFGKKPNAVDYTTGAAVGRRDDRPLEPAPLTSDAWDFDEDDPTGGWGPVDGEAAPASPASPAPVALASVDEEASPQATVSAPEASEPSWDDREGSDESGGDDDVRDAPVAPQAPKEVVGDQDNIDDGDDAGARDRSMSEYVRDAKSRPVPTPGM